MESIIIDGQVYVLSGPAAPKRKRRLVLSLIWTQNERENNLADAEMRHYDRAYALRSTFAQSFPDAPALTEVAYTSSTFCEWRYTLHDAQEKHLAWARSAKACRLIDSFCAQEEE
jgi:hypothetical protein